MEFKQDQTGQLEITLTAEELETMGLTYDELESGEEETRNFILALMDTAQMITGFDLGTRICVEMYPGEDDGCVLCFSDLTAQDFTGWRLRQQVISPVIYAFEDVNTLITGAVKLFRRCSHRIRQSALYRVEDGWRLAIYPLDVLENITLSFLDEYAPRCGQGELAAVWLEEHGEQVLAENAVDLLSAYFG